MATWLVIERHHEPGSPALYDIERRGRAFAYDLDIGQAQDRIARSRFFQPSTDKIVLVSADGGREVLTPRRRP